MTDKITILTSKGPLLTKRWTDAGIEPYDRAKNFTVETLAVEDIEHLSRILTTKEEQPRCCVIRGVWGGVQHAETTRDLEHFSPTLHNWVCLDVDDFEPMLSDPVAEPAYSVAEFIHAKLPHEFHTAAHHWQLSSSAGAPGNEDKLKAHIWFWLDQARSGEELTIWAKTLKVPVDVTVFRTVQVHYTAAPVIDPGVSCPVTVRSGFVAGDACVALAFDDEWILAQTPGERMGRDGMIDPGSKPGLIGAFCRAYPPERVITEVLAEHFEYEGDSEVRVTWLGGGGSPGGACVTDDGMHVFNGHNTDPLSGRAANMWDLVRHYMFSHLDVGADDFTLMEMGTTPSYIAMRAWVRALPDIQEEMVDQLDAPVPGALPDSVAQKHARALKGALTLIAQCSVAADLEGVVCERIRNVGDWTDLDSEQLAKAVQLQGKTITGATVPIRTVRGWLRAPRAGGAAGAGPDWLEGWVYITAGDLFFHLKTKLTVTSKGFDALNTMQMPLIANSLRRESASDWAVRVYNVQTVGNVTYAPGQPEVFTLLGVEWANTYREDSVPATAEGGDDAIALVKSHIEMLFPDPRERQILISWMAHNVRYPGKKIRWAPYIFGPQGTGKTYLLELMSCVMGAQNVRSLSGSTLLSPFNSWCVGHALVGIEEIYQAGHLYETEEKLKAPLSNNTVDVHRKGRDAYCAPNCTNYLILSNHPDGMPVGEGDRRLFFLRCALSTDAAKLLATAGYYDTLFDTTRANIGALRRWLLSEVEMHIEFDAEGRAPVTRARNTVVQMSKSDADLAAESVLGEHRVVTTDWIATQLKNLGIETVKGRSITRALERHGFEYVKNVWIDGRARRVYARADAMHLDEEGLRAQFGITQSSIMADFE